jgi:hypothetical protein
MQCWRRIKRLVCGGTTFWFAERIVVLRDSMSLLNICNGSGLNGEYPLGIGETWRISGVVGVSGKVRHYNFVTWVKRGGGEARNAFRTFLNSVCTSVGKYNESDCLSNGSFVRVHDLICDQTQALALGYRRHTV